MQINRTPVYLTISGLAIASVVLALAIYHWPARQAAATSLPALQGEAAVEHLKQQGLYASLGEAMTATQYGIKSVPENLRSEHGNHFVADNSANNLRAGFAPERVELTPASQSSGAWHLGITLRSAGYGDQQLKVDAGNLTTQGSRIEYERPVADGQSTIKEWYVNTRSGLEQGFTLAQAPGERRAGEPLRLTLAMESKLRARAESDGQAVEFLDAAGNNVLRYDHLAVSDARGQTLAARMSVKGQELLLEVEDASAVYPVTIDPTFSQQAYLKASNTGAGDEFGSSIAVSGDMVVVGARLEESNATGVNGNQADNSAINSGAAYVFVRNGTTWSQQAYLKASNTEAEDNFGISVAVSGDTVVVGAWLEDSSATGVNGDQADNFASGAGAAYVFVRSGTAWSQQAYLKASNTDRDNHFGFSVAVSGDTVVVGANLEWSNATGVNGNQADKSQPESGAAYVFVRNGTAWSQQAYLKASNTFNADSFGRSVAVSGNTVVVGAFGEDSNATGVNGNQADNSAESAGAAYVFVRNGTAWSQQAYLKASNTNAREFFGESVAVSGDTVVVGARLEDSNATGVNGNQADNSAINSGAAYVFVRNGTAWSQQAYLKASNTNAGDEFGYSVAVSGDTVVVGARLEDSNATGVNGNQTDNSAGDSGAAYVFVRNGTAWSQQNYLKASNTDAMDYFGRSVAVSGDTVVVGANGERSNATGVNGNQADNSFVFSGAVYVFKGSIVVNSLADGAPANNGQCTLREALINANNNNQSGSTDCAAGNGADVITFSVTGTINLTSALPSISDTLNIAGPGANQLTVRRDTGGDYRIFDIIFFNGQGVKISDLTVTNGRSDRGAGIRNGYVLTLANCVVTGNTATVNGGGVRSAGGVMTITDSTISGNSSETGGGIYAFGGANVTITGSTISGNNAVQSGGIEINGSTFTLTNSTISGNTTDGLGAITNRVAPSSLTMTNCTVTGNQGPSALYTDPDPTLVNQLRNTLFAGNIGPNFSTQGAPLTSLGNNLDSDGTSGFTNGVGGNIVGTAVNKLNAKLGPLANNGGPTQTHALLLGSPAIDAGTATGAPTNDQRRVSRPKGGGVDIGAFESLPPIVVNSLADGAPTNNGQCTLREALINANNNNQSGSNDCAAGDGLDTLTFSVTGTINLTGALPGISDTLYIAGPGANQLTVRRDTGGDYRIFTINGGTTNISGLTVTNGKASDGGGIQSNGSNLTLSDCVVTGNTATEFSGGVDINSGSVTINRCTISNNGANTGGGGGAYFGANVTIIGSTISGNNAVQSGGIEIQGSVFTLTNSTISGNIGTNGVGAITNHIAPSNLTMTNCTVTGNQGLSVFYTDPDPTLVNQLRNTLFAGNIGSNFSTQGAPLTSLGNNLDSDGTSGFTNGVGGNIVGTAVNKLNAKLGPLANNGGATQTHLLLCGSPAINAGSNTGAPSTDQRGFVRPVGGTTDIGAVEGDYSISLSATALPKGRVNTTYPTQTLSATGGTAPYVFTAVTPLPGGLTLGANGAINGTPTTAVSNFSFTVMAVDAAGKQGCRDYLLTIDPACPTITISPATLPNGQLGAVYNQLLTQSGGTGAIAWSFTGNLPGNVTLNSTTGLISGTPTTSGTFNFSVTATDANGCASAPKAYSLVIASCPAITINPATLPGGQIGLQYSQQLTQTGGTGTLTWSVTGTLPSGVTLNLTTGLLSGKPTASGTFNFSVGVKDVNNCTATPKAYSLVIAPCPSIAITPASLSPGTVGTQFSQLLTASGGTAPYAFSINPGSTLPPGLSLSGSTLVGSPTTANSFSFTMKVTDAAGCTGTQSYTLLVNPAITSNGLQFYPLTKPLRLLDTRPANERPGGAFDLPGAKLTGELNGGTPRTQNARVTFDGLTIPANAKAIVGTATVINYPGAGQYPGTGNVTFYPSNKPKPEVSNLNYAANQTISNGFTVALGDDGAFKIFSYSGVHLVVDVVGYYAPPGAGGLYFHPLPRPVRALETRPELFYPGCETPRAKLLAGSTRLLAGRFSCEGITIPSSAQALVGNLTSVNANANGEAEVYAGDVAPLPLANTLSYVSTQAIPNAFVTRLSGTGSYNLYVSQTTDMLVDLTGYFSAEANDINGQGLLLTLLETPIRKLETRPELFYPGCITPRAPLAGGSETVIPALGTCGGVTIPATARALIGNATVVNFVSQGSGNVTLYPTAANRPESSNLNYVANQVIPNAFTVGLSADGKFTVYVFSTIHLLIDVSGYYAP